MNLETVGCSGWERGCTCVSCEEHDTELFMKLGITRWDNVLYTNKQETEL